MMHTRNMLLTRSSPFVPKFWVCRDLSISSCRVVSIAGFLSVASNVVLCFLLDPYYRFPVRMLELPFLHPAPERPALWLSTSAML